MKIDLTRVLSGENLKVGPAIMIVPTINDATTVDLYRQFREAPANCQSRKKNVAIVATGLLNTPDQVSGIGCRRDGNSFEINLETRRFEGPLAGNDPWFALIKMELGSLKQGIYTLAIKERVLRFIDFRHPEHATNSTTTKQHMSFDCI
ncbi:MAG: hypothetical protein L3J84_11295 [Gammaproteobacteria bacterium]|nr:hypothetical protein [Gammaproteobacteria bacterium]